MVEFWNSPFRRPSFDSRQSAYFASRTERLLRKIHVIVDLHWPVPLCAHPRSATSRSLRESGSARFTLPLQPFHPGETTFRVTSRRILCTSSVNGGNAFSNDGKSRKAKTRKETSSLKKLYEITEPISNGMLISWRFIDASGNSLAQSSAALPLGKIVSVHFSRPKLLGEPPP